MLRRLTGIQLAHQRVEGLGALPEVPDVEDVRRLGKLILLKVVVEARTRRAEIGYPRADTVCARMQRRGHLARRRAPARADLIPAPASTMTFFGSPGCSKYWATPYAQ